MSPETRELAKAQLVGIRATIGALQAQVVSLETLLGQEPDDRPAEARGCPHTETENVGTFGAPAYKCLACHETVTG